MPQSWEPEPATVTPDSAGVHAPPEHLAHATASVDLGPTVVEYRPAAPLPAPARRSLRWPIVLLVLLSYVGWHWGDLTELFRSATAPGYELPAASSLSTDAPPDEYGTFGSTDLVRHIERELIAQSPRIDVTAWAGDDQDFANVWDAWREAIAQNPYVYVDAGHAMRTPVRVVIRPTYTYAADEAERRRALTVSAARAGLDAAGVIDEPDATEKVRRIYDYIAAIAEYDERAAVEIESGLSSQRVNHSQEAYGILVDGYAVCSGYAKAFVVMATLAGLDAIEVTGSDSAGQYGGSHAWNKVYVNGAWRLVDITFDDAGRFASDDYLLLRADDPLLDTRTEDNDWMTDAQMADYRG